MFDYRSKYTMYWLGKLFYPFSSVIFLLSFTLEECVLTPILFLFLVSLLGGIFSSTFMHSIFRVFVSFKHISSDFSYQWIFQVIPFILPFIYFCNAYHSFFFLLLITVFLLFHDLLHHHLFSEEYLLSFCFSFPCPLVYT